MFSIEPLWMGVLNITPDSFSDGGQFLSTEKALSQAKKLIAEGAHIIDIGAESTRPYATPIEVSEEIRRLLPVVQAIRKESNIPISIDTQKPEVLKELLPFNIQILNDTTGGTQEAFAPLVKAYDLTWILMHSQGSPQTMQQNPTYSEKGVVEEVRLFFEEKIHQWASYGIANEKLWVDPGIGFGKTLSHNLLLLKNLSSFSKLGGRLVLGTSRKSFIAKLEDPATSTAQERLGGTIGSNLWGYSQGASVFRVHEVFPNKQALLVWKSINEK